VDFALVEVVDIDVVVVIRLVAMETIPSERLTQSKPQAKAKIARVEKDRTAGCREDSLARSCVVRSLAM